MNAECTGAGIILFYDNRGVKQTIVEGLDEGILYLCLNDLNSYLDFPKGSKDFGEFPLDCAIRETFEEINLSSEDYFMIDRIGKDFYTRDDQDKYLKMYIGEIKKDSLSKPRIKTNLHTNIKEHKDFYFLKKDDCVSKLLSYLKEPLEWCDNIVLDFLEA